MLTYRLLLAIVLLLVNQGAINAFTADSTLLARGFTKVRFVAEENLQSYLLQKDEINYKINELCKNVKSKYAIYGWKDDPCGDVKWKAIFHSQDKWPLIYTEFGQGDEVTLFLGGVHPDELTPIHLAFHFARHLQANKNLYEAQKKIIVAPLVNPDGFLKARPSRSNGTVDVNRNFFTLDWYDEARDAWQKRRDRSDRYFPGFFPNTEIETLFQIKLMDEYAPDKIFSVHAPLGFYDYDGPGDGSLTYLSVSAKQAKRFVYEVAAKSKNYEVKEYSFYPGSLGNFAGNERNLPTITLELESTRVELVDAYWQRFLPAFIHSFQYEFKRERALLNGNATRFYQEIYKPILAFRD